MYVYSPTDELSPGDIIKSVRLVERTANAESETIRAVPVNVIVLSQGCEIDKVAKHGKSGSLVVAAVFALGSLDRGLQGLARKNAVLKSFYLPDFDNRMPECYIGWETIQPVELMPVWNARRTERYVCSVAENSELWQALANRFWDYFFRPLARDGSDFIPLNG